MHTIWRVQVQPQAHVKGADAELDRGQSLQITESEPEGPNCYH